MMRRVVCLLVVLGAVTTIVALAATPISSPPRVVKLGLVEVASGLGQPVFLLLAARLFPIRFAQAFGPNETTVEPGDGRVLAMPEDLDVSCMTLLREAGPDREKRR